MLEDWKIETSWKWKLVVSAAPLEPPQKWGFGDLGIWEGNLRTHVEL